MDHPEVFRAQNSLGDVWVALERWEEAVVAYRRAIEAKPDAVSSYLQLGPVLMKLKRWTEVVAAYEHLIALDPTRVQAYDNLGRALSQLNRRREAVVAYERAAELEPDNVSACSNFAQALVKVGRWQAAASAYQRAIRLDHDGSAWHHGLGDALLKLGRFDEAAAAFLLADKLNPSWSRRPLGAAVATTERWLESLVPDTDAMATGNSRVLFVLDADYGELTTAMCLLLGQGLATRATLLLPPRLFVTNKDVLPGRTHCFGSLDDVMARVDAEPPELVFLCSGYVYSLHELLTLEGLEQLVQVLGERGCRVVTSDPFLGLLSDLGNSTTVSLDIPKEAPPRLRYLKEVVDEQLESQLAVSARILEEIPHLYPAYPAADQHTTLAAARSVSFFNPRLVRRADEPGGDAPIVAGKPLWLFVIASSDYEVQTMFHGKDRYVDLVVEKLEQALRADRHPVFIGPYDCVQALIHHMASAGGRCELEGVTLMTFCPFKHFSALVLSAEYVFYWNMLSHSMFLRLFNGLPVFLFDRGHLVRNVTPLHERIVDWYYQGWDPIYLDQEQALRPEHLKVSASRYREAAIDVNTRMRRSPAPELMIEQLLG